jgi:NAD-dependent deacetylase
VTAVTDLADVTGWLCAAGRVTVLTGAGISTSSGIPDFRGPQGIWTLNPDAQRMFSLDEYVRDPQLRVKAWINRRDHPAWTAQPNPGHLALVDLERSGRLRALLTQNIDGLHQRAGSDPDRVLELHGTLFGVECLQCNARTSMEEALARVAAEEPDPPCLICGGVLKAATISFGQALRAEVLDAAVRAAADCDVFLAVGTSLQVQPAAGLCEVAVARGARLIIVNADPTPYDGMAAALVREEISDVLPALLAS